MAKKINLVGRRFGRLTVLAEAPGKRMGYQKVRRAMWQCQCDCGNVRIIMSDSLLQERTRSCGCLRNEQSTQNLRNGRKPTLAA